MLAALASLAFVALGLPDGLLGVAWPSMRQTFGLSLDDIGWLLAAFAAGYVGSSVGGGRALVVLGLGWLLVLSCVATGLCLVGYALSGGWGAISTLALLGGIGAGGIDTGINTYAALHHGPRMLNWLHACYGIGATSGPVLMTAVLASGLPWQHGYVMAAAAQLLLAVAFVLTVRLWPAAGEAARGERMPDGFLATLRRPVVLLSMLVFFAYTGLETAVGAWTFTLLTEGRGVSTMAAGPAASLFWTGLATGRVLGATLANRLSGDRLIALSLAGVLSSILVVASGLSPLADAAGLLVAGASAGPVFPMLISTTPARVGAAAAGTVVGAQIAAAAAGQALLPTAAGAVGDWIGVAALAPALVGMALVPLALHHVLRRLTEAGVGVRPA